MGQALTPRSGNSLTPSRVAERLGKAFSFVQLDFEAGRKAAIAQAQRIEATPAAMFLGQHAQALDYARRLRAVTDQNAAVIAFGDSPDSTLRVTLLPGEPIRFGYASVDEEERNRELVLRCATALDCEIVNF